MNSKAFNGHIMVEFKFNVFEVFKQHLCSHNSVIPSFKPNELVIQTMCDDVDIRGFYTTRIPSESLDKYEFDCNRSEVNVMVTKSLIRSKIVGGCKNINVVPNGIFLISEGVTEPLVEVSFDLYEKNLRRKSKVNDDDDDDVISSEIFGRIVKRPYLHYLFTSRIDYKIHRICSNFRYSSIVVRNPRLFNKESIWA